MDHGARSYLKKVFTLYDVLYQGLMSQNMISRFQFFFLHKVQNREVEKKGAGLRVKFCMLQAHTNRAI